MRSILLTSNDDIINGLRLAGVRSVKCKDRSELLKNFKAYKNDEEIGIIILTYSSFNEIKDEVLEFKLTGKLPLVVTIPDLDGKMEDDFNLKQKEECENKIREEKEKAEKVLADKVEKLKEDEKSYVDRRVALAKRRGYELIASVEEQKRVLFLEEDEKLLRELLETLSQKLLAFTKTEEYVNLEIKNFREILDEIDEKKIYLYIKNDENKELVEKFKEIAKEKGMELEIDELFDYHIGGFIISDVDKTYNINLSLKNKLDDMRYEIGSMLHEKLKERGEVIGKGIN